MATVHRERRYVEESKDWLGRKTTEEGVEVFEYDKKTDHILHKKIPMKRTETKEKVNVLW